MRICEYAYDFRLYTIPIPYCSLENFIWMNWKVVHATHLQMRKYFALFGREMHPNCMKGGVCVSLGIYVREEGWVNNFGKWHIIATTTAKTKSCSIHQQLLCSTRSVPTLSSESDNNNIDFTTPCNMRVSVCSLHMHIIQTTHCNWTLIFNQTNNSFQCFFHTNNICIWSFEQSFSVA